MAVEKEPKPKKSFEAKITVWDDGEVDVEMYEYRDNPSGRGAPGKWRLSNKDFVKRIDEVLGDPKMLLDTTYDALGGLNLELAESHRKMEQPSSPAVQPVKEVKEPKKKKVEEDTPETEQPKDEDVAGGDMDFGDFDNKKDK